ncbi:MAG: ABC transporter permease [Planctomycetota bacterium]
MSWLRSSKPLQLHKHSAEILLARTWLSARPGRVLATGISLGFYGGLLLLSLLVLQENKGKARRLPAALLAPQEVHMAAMDLVCPVVSPGLEAELQSDPRVSKVVTGYRVRAFDLPGDENGELDREAFYEGNMQGWIPGKRMELLAWADGFEEGELSEGQWPRETSDGAIEVVVPNHLRWSMNVGDVRRLECDTGVYAAKVVGFQAMEPAFIATRESQRFLPWRISRSALERLSGGKPRASDLRVFLKSDSERSEFLGDWRARVKGLPSSLELWDQETIRDRAVQSMPIKSARAIAFALVIACGACVVCIALSLQATQAKERVNQFGLLRSLGASGGALAKSMMLESTMIAGIGLLMSSLLALAFLKAVPLLGLPARLDGWSVVMVGGVLWLGMVLGSVWPSYMVSLIAPSGVAVETTGLRYASVWSRRWMRGALGCAAITIVVTLLTPSGSSWRALSLGWLGIPCIFLVTILVTPWTTQWMTRVLTVPLARLTGTHPLVLKDQVAGGFGRHTGLVITLAMGLGGFVWVLCWGASMLEPFVVDAKLPRWMVSVYPIGLDRSETESTLSQPLLREMHPLVLVDTRLDQPDAPEGTSAVPTLVCGMETSFARDRLPIRFVSGDRSTAFARFAKEDVCWVSEWYATSHGIEVGDQIAVAVPKRDAFGIAMTAASEETSDRGIAAKHYEVTGVIRLKGWLMSTKQNKTRLQSEPHQLMVVLRAEVVRRDFRTAYANYLWGDSPAAESSDLLNFQEAISLKEATRRSRPVREAIAAEVGKAVNLTRPVSFSTREGGRVTTTHRSVQADDLARLRVALRGEWGGAAVKRLGWLPLTFLMLSLASVTGSLVASMRVRSREIGVLRSVGLTRAGLLRLAIAEGLLQGFSAIVVAIFLGASGAWVLLQITRIVGFDTRWSGIGAGFLIPWPWLLPGFALTILVSVLAAIFAGLRIGLITPARLYGEEI